MAADTALAAITVENLRQLLHIQTELREQAETRERKAQRVLVGLLETFAPDEVDQRLKSGRSLDSLPVEELEQRVRQHIGNQLHQAQVLRKTARTPKPYSTIATSWISCATSTNLCVKRMPALSARLPAWRLSGTTCSTR